MSAMSTVLTEFSNKENGRTSTLAGHTALLPKLVIEKHRLAEGNQIMNEYSAKVVETTVDAESLPIPQKVSFEVVVRYPVNGQSSTITAALATFRDIIAGDEFGNSVTTTNFL